MTDHSTFDAPASTPQSWTVLGLESSCDDTAAALVRLFDTGQVEVIANAVQSQNDAHAPYGGVVPEIAARAHAERMDHLVEQVMAESGLDFEALDGIAATAGPGLIGGVMAALMTAKGLALGANKPLIAVNHLEGHALSAKLTEDVEFPYLLLLVSGGHTQLLIVEGLGQMTRLGSTIDDAAGEAFDKTAKIMGLGFPGGPAVEKLAKTAQNPERFNLPRMLIKDKSCDLSFAGLKTAVKRAFDRLDAPSLADKADLAAAAQAAITRHLTERTARAMSQFKDRFPDLIAPPLIVAGGVAANQTIRQSLEKAAQEAGFTLIAPPMKYCTDNAAMIALAGAERLKRGLIDDLDAPARARWPLDEAAAMTAPKTGAGRKGPKA